MTKPTTENGGYCSCTSRRGFLKNTVAGGAVAVTSTQPQTLLAAEGDRHASADPDRLDVPQLEQLQAETRVELFDRVLPFWERYGIDLDRGGFMCALDYDGSLKHTDKYHWYQGRGIWVYSYLYNHFGRDDRHLEIARKTKDFLLENAVDQDGWWAEALTQDGRVLKPFQGDVYGMFCAAEGLQEYAWAAQHDESRERSRQLLKELFARVSQPDYQDAYAPQKGHRVLGTWMYLLQACTQYLNRWEDRDLERYAELSVDAIMNKHFNPDIELVNEYLTFDFGRTPEIANKCQVGHCVQAFWMVMDEARRRQDTELLKTCIERTRRHLDVGWDHVFGGIVEWINVDRRTHIWGPQRLGDVTVDLKMVGEKNYLKSFWSLNEVLLATLYIYELYRPAWAARYFRLARDVVDRKFSRHRQGQATYVLASDRRMQLVPASTRQDNYHPLRRLMRNLRSIERLLAKEAAAG